MQLPVIPSRSEPDPATLIRAAHRAHAILARVVNEETTLDAATVFVDSDRPNDPIANTATDTRIPDALDAAAAVDQIVNHFRDSGTNCHSVLTSDDPCPSDLAAALEQAGFRLARFQLNLLDRFKPPANPCAGLQTIPARAAYSQLTGLLIARAEEEFPHHRAAAADIAATWIDQLDEPRYEAFLGRIDGQPAGLTGVLTLGQIGVIQPPFTHRDHRRKGVAAALLAQTLDHCARAQLEQVIIEAPENCPAQPLYESLGFRPLTTTTRFLRQTQP